MKVFNTGKRPIVYVRYQAGPKVIHPGKSVDLPEKEAEEVILLFKDATPFMDEAKEEKKPKKKGV
jgi:hypothetical protein